MAKTSMAAAVMVVLATAVAAGTVYLNTGVRIDAVVTERPDGLYTVKAGAKTLTMRPGEIKRIEKNEKTGAFDKEAALARWAVRDAELTQLTGLTADQRRQVKALMFKLQTSSVAERTAARDTLVAMQQEMDVFPYLAWQFPQLSHRLAPWVLEAMFYVDVTRVLKYLREGAVHPYAGTRARAIELMGRFGDRDSAPLIARGLLDHDMDVRIQAAYALARIGAKKATPALIETLKHPDLRVSNSGREALTALWSGAIGDEKPRTVSEFTAIWEANKGGVGSPLQLAKLEPLIAAEEEFEDE